MDNNLKNIVILKNLPSNFVEEAIVILKQNNQIKKFHLIENTSKKNSNGSEKNQIKKDDFIIKEAENVVSDYISKIENQDFNGDKKNTKLKEKCKKLKILSISLSCALIFFMILSFI